ncbi:MAG: PTS sugar transporter subunit IIC [Defluviitaleaceae bacterium]|nr:PTS sugar transporter subunit IIC [Defluviitaleaceae bacterium]MCL2239443.1 PTS sugar transporter subunit IIC [Defluviitaleaceae bacterium]
MKTFLKRKDIEISFKRYCVDAMGAMTLGLFASLIIGLILFEIGSRAGIGFLATMGEMAAGSRPVGGEGGYVGAVGFAMGVAVAYGLKAPPLVLFASAAVGFAGNFLGGPAGALIAALIGAELGKMVSKETKIDIIVTPVVTLLAGIGVAMLVGPPIGTFMDAVGNLIMWATDLMPVLMGAVIAVVMGMMLTGPLSSAALAIMLGLEGLAAGAAVAGCAANMIGFAVASYRENKIGGLISQGLGTSMLQLPNIMKNPRIWIPPIIASAIVGPISAAAFGMKNIPAGAGMGTSGLVGQFGAFTAMGYSGTVFLQVGLVHFILPAIIALAVSEFMRKKGWIQFGDMALGG